MDENLITLFEKLTDEQKKDVIDWLKCRSSV